MKRFMMSFCLLLLFPLLSSAETQKKTFTRVDVIEQQRFNQEEKVALVVGVGDYPKHSGLSRLNYADDDARVISDQLKQLGYRVKVLVNAEATKGAVLNLLDQFGQVLDKVNISYAFALGKYEITVAEYRDFVESSGYRSERGCMVYDEKSDKWNFNRQLSWKNPGFRQNDNHPVTCIAVVDAQAYMKWLSKESGKAYRLPSEAEWEYAARAGTRTKYSFGNNEARLCDFGNGGDQTRKGSDPSWPFGVSDCHDGFAYTAPVGQFHPNRFGLYDMHGNVTERVGDCWHANYKGAPVDGRAWTSGSCIPSMLRGGSWTSDPDHMRSAYRGGNDGAVYSFGFRVARDM